jgi:putative membrane protein
MLALFVADYFLSGIMITGIWSGFFAAIILGFVNGFIRPIFILLTIPITILSLGLFLFVINGIMLVLTAVIVPGFMVSGIFAAIWGSIIITLAANLIENIVD